MAHVAILLPLFSAQVDPPVVWPEPPPPILVTLVEPPAPPPPPPPPRPEPPPGPKADPQPPAGPPSPAPAAPPAKARPTPPAPAPRPARVPVKPPPEVETVPVRAPAPPAPMATLSDAQLAGATTAGSGGGMGGGGGGGDGFGGGGGSGAGDGGCDMVRWLQDALRTDPEVRAAVARAHREVGPGKALLVWNGDWIRNPGEEGEGLAGVRQAISMEVAFAPHACRAQPMRGLVLISFNDAPGGPRLVLGKGSWRWADMLRGR
jgi:hypothetical protein